MIRSSRASAPRRVFAVVAVAVAAAFPARADVPDVLQAGGGVVESYDTPIWDDPAGLVADNDDYIDGTPPQSLVDLSDAVLNAQEDYLRDLKGNLLVTADTLRSVPSSELESRRDALTYIGDAIANIDRLLQMNAGVNARDPRTLDLDSDILDPRQFQSRIGEVEDQVELVIALTSGYTGASITTRNGEVVVDNLETGNATARRLVSNLTVTRARTENIKDAPEFFNDMRHVRRQTNDYLRDLGRRVLQCSSPCALGSLGLGLNDMVSRSAFYFAGRSAHAAPIMNAFGPRSQFDWTWINERSQGPISQFDRTWINERSQGPISQFDHTWINERSHGPLSPFDHSWINARSQGPVSQFDHSWINARSYDADDVQSWSQRFPSPNGLPATMPSDAAGGLSETLLAELEGLDARQLFDQESRDAVAELLAAKLVREFDIDPAVGDAVANGTLIAITQALAASPGALLGGGSSGGFSDITLELPLLFRVFDFATVDNDIITLRVTDQNGLQLGPLEITLSGPAAADTFAPDVAAGPIEISITAENTGLFFPNTGEIDVLSNITQGATTQRFNLTTGETGVLSITATPPPSP